MINLFIPLLTNLACYFLIGARAIEVENELTRSAFTTKPVSERDKNGRRGAIVSIDSRGNYTMPSRDVVRLLYDTEHRDPEIIFTTNHRGLAAHIEKYAQKLVKKLLGGIHSVLWTSDGSGGEGNGSGSPPYVTALAYIILRHEDDADNRNPMNEYTSIASRCLPVDGVIFREDIANGCTHVNDFVGNDK